MSRRKKSTKTFTNLITYLLFAVLVLGLLGGIMYLLNRPDGIYLVYDGEDITSDNSGITVNWSADESEATFTIQNTEDWGAYTVQDCTVKVIPKVTTENDFDFAVDGGNYLFSSESDLTAAFVKDYLNYDGSGLTINEDGEFSLYLIAYTEDYAETAMSELLSRVYGGETVTIDSEIDIIQNVYFAIELTSPDGATTFTVDFRFEINDLLLSDTAICF